jgi:thioesterase domain-containing protein
MDVMATNDRARTPDADGLRVLRAAADPGLPPVVLVHPGALPPSVYNGLIAALPAGPAVLVADLERVPEYPEAALHPERATELTIESLGERVLRWLPDGLPPGFVLAGWSFGGTVALDVVRRLDNEVSALVVLDALAPVREYTVDDDGLDADDRVTEWFAMYLAARRGVSAPTTPQVAGVTERLLALLDAGVRTGLLLPGTTPEGLRKAYQAYAGGLARNNRLSKRYPAVVSRVDTPVALVRPACGMVRTPGALGWGQVASTVTVHSCPGDHYSMLAEPAGVRLVAELCAAALEPKGKVHE